VKTTSKSAILITGASKGLGREAARRLAAAGHQVWAAARDPERGRARSIDGRIAHQDLQAGRTGPATSDRHHAE
jgi:NAD(P)-dependent dehydrogenase (short-subunit alcohol dehydrogenase family)